MKIKFLLSFAVSLLFSNAIMSFDVCLPPLPEPYSNNAVASLELDDKIYIASFAGLKGGKTWRDTSKSAFMFVSGDDAWKQIPDIPVNTGRLAASAESVGDKFYLFGGYTVAEDGSEKSTPEVFSFDPLTERYQRLADMPTPVDDMVTFTYRGRYIYLVSGWHDVGNVSLVQIYDIKTNTWTKGTDYPGTPVFGHAGGIVKNRFVIADGVAVVGKDSEGRRIFDTVNEGWLGTIDPDDPTEITYQKLPQLPGRGHYRMAAAGDEARNQVIFMGGTPTAYNYNGIGYNGKPAEPSEHMYAWSFSSNNWVLLNDKPVPSMDHRGAVKIDDLWWTIGGLDVNRSVVGYALGEKLFVCSKSIIE
jgi:N-acetylneuraminic acid mutarotase